MEKDLKKKYISLNNCAVHLKLQHFKSVILQLKKKEVGIVSSQYSESGKNNLEDRLN